MLRFTGAYNEKPLVSICTTTKDRLEHIQKTFLRNIRDNQNYPNCEFLLLNYSCPDPETEIWVKETISPYIASGRVNYYYYPNSSTYNVSHAKNLASRLAQGDIVCNVDADNYTGKDFVSYLAAALNRENTFLCGPRDGRGLGGRIAVRRKDWESVGGYDERFKSYAPDDLDFTKRLCLIGLKKKVILHEKFCSSILHSDELRKKHNEGDYLQEYWDIMNNNIDMCIANPNGFSFGHGRVKKNFNDWLEV